MDGAGELDMYPTRLEQHWGRVVRCYSDRPRNVSELLKLSVLRSPEAVAIVDGDRRITYAELNKLILERAQELHARASQREIGSR